MDVRSERLPLPWTLLSDTLLANLDAPARRGNQKAYRFVEGAPHVVHFKMWVTAPAGVLPDLSLTIRNGDLVGKATYETTQLPERQLVKVEPLPEAATTEWKVRLMDGVQGKSWAGSFLFNGRNRSEPRTWWLRSGDRELASGSFGLGEAPRSMPPAAISPPEAPPDGAPIPGPSWP